MLYYYDITPLHLLKVYECQGGVLRRQNMEIQIISGLPVISRVERIICSHHRFLRTDQLNW